MTSSVVVAGGQSKDHAQGQQQGRKKVFFSFIAGRVPFIVVMFHFCGWRGEAVPAGGYGSPFLAGDGSLSSAPQRPGTAVPGLRRYGRIAAWPRWLPAPSSQRRRQVLGQITSAVPADTVSNRP